jgi:glutamyl-tRNA synthetase
LNELAEAALFLFRVRPIVLDDTAAGLLDSDGLVRLRDARDVIAKVDDWSAPALETAVRTVADTAGIGLGKVAQPLRAALTGQATSPGIFEVLEVLGRDESLGRLDDQLRGAAPAAG